MMSDDTLTEITNMYSRMSLLELLAEENMIAKYLHKNTLDPMRSKLQKLLRSEIERRLQ